MAEQVSLMSNQGIIQHWWPEETLKKSMLSLDKRRVAADEVANQLQISHSSAYEIICDRHHFHKVCTKLASKTAHRVAVV
jgi:hypothetical protein